MKARLLRKRTLLILGVDVILVIGAWYLAYLVRFDFDIPDRQWVTFKKVLPLILIVKTVNFYFFDLYRGMWRYTSVSDLLNIIKAATVSSLIVISGILLGTRFEGFARSVFIIDWCLTVIFVAGYRLGIRLVFDLLKEDKPLRSAARAFFLPLHSKRADSVNLLIIGAGDCGEKIYREIRDNARLSYNVVGFLDDDNAKRGKKIHSIPVLGEIEDIQAIVKKFGADEALIAIPSASSQQMRTIVNLCKDSGVEFKTIPGMGELINGKVIEISLVEKR
jgi:FlaA1/EpsC-like NDP-sugar epimerase